MSESVDSCHQVLSTGGSVVPDVLPLTLVSAVHGLPKPIGQRPCKLKVCVCVNNNKVECLLIYVNF